MVNVHIQDKMDCVFVMLKGKYKKPIKMLSSVSPITFADLAGYPEHWLPRDLSVMTADYHII